MKQTELEQTILLPGTILVEILDKETTSKSGLIVSTVSKQKKGKVVKISTLPTENKDHILNVRSEDIVLLANGDNEVVHLDGKKYELLREDRGALLILERNQMK